MPVPISLIGFAIRILPEKTFEEMREHTPEPYQCLITKETIRMLFGECLDILKENKGIEIVHVEARDGTFVSIKL